MPFGVVRQLVEPVPVAAVLAVPAAVAVPLVAVVAGQSSELVVHQCALVRGHQP
ncbi:hypothetical protein D3C81_2173550 [compost metagenome]